MNATRLSRDPLLIKSTTLSLSSRSPVDRPRARLQRRVDDVRRLVDDLERRDQGRLDVDRRRTGVGEQAAPEHLHGDRVLQLGVSLAGGPVAYQLQRRQRADGADVAEGLVTCGQSPERGPRPFLDRTHVLQDTGTM